MPTKYSILMFVKLKNKDYLTDKWACDVSLYISFNLVVQVVQRNSSDRSIGRCPMLFFSSRRYRISLAIVFHIISIIATDSARTDK